jgi:hypothetical protein
MFGSFGVRTEQLRICEEIQHGAHARRPIDVRGERQCTAYPLWVAEQGETP